MTQGLTWAAITPARNEAENLGRLGCSLAEQSVPPLAWIVVDNGSTDDSVSVTKELSQLHSWIHLATTRGEVAPVRGKPIVQAFMQGLNLLDVTPDVVVKLDADVSMDSNYFERLLDQFNQDPQLGIASGTCLELHGASWETTHVTAGHVRGASRAYRWLCLQDVLPLEHAMGWDGVDELRANLKGWRTATIAGLPFYHHRRVGQRDGSRRKAWSSQGRASYYMGYRLSYLALRSLHHARRDRSALMMIVAYVGSAVRREDRCSDREVRSYLRRQQALRRLPERAREAFGRQA